MFRGPRTSYPGMPRPYGRRGAGILLDPGSRRRTNSPPEVSPMNPGARGRSKSSMRCMEIRGGSRAVEEAFDTPGLDAWLSSRPFEGAERGGDLHYISLCGGGVITRMVVA